MAFKSERPGPGRSFGAQSPQPLPADTCAPPRSPRSDGTVTGGSEERSDAPAGRQFLRILKQRFSTRLENGHSTRGAAAAWERGDQRETRANRKSARCAPPCAQGSPKVKGWGEPQAAGSTWAERGGPRALKSTPPPCGREQVGEPCLGFPVWKMGTRLVSPPGRPGALTEGYKAPSAARNTQ